MSHYLRTLPSHTFQEQDITEDFERFIIEEVLPRIEFRGYKIAEQQQLAMQMIHNLIMSGLVGACVADSRDPNSNGSRFRNKVWDAIIDADLAVWCKGSEMSGMTTRYAASTDLLGLREEWEIRMLLNLHLQRNTQNDPIPLSLIYLHTGKMDPATGELLPDAQRKQPIPFYEVIHKTAQRLPNGEPDPQAVQNAIDFWSSKEDVIEKINRSNLSHSWQAFYHNPKTRKTHTFQPNVCLRQIHVGQFFRAARLYSWSTLSGQSLSKQQRQEMLIDGEKTAELDFSGMSPRMLYHTAAGNKCDPVGDVYKPAEVFPKFWPHCDDDEEKTIVRDFLKQATNILLNVVSHRATRKLRTVNFQLTPTAT